MKKNLNYFILVFIILLTGCSINHKSTGIISKYKTLSAKDIASEYNIDGKSLQVYSYTTDPHIDYVNVSEFIKFMQGGIDKLDIAKSNVMTISYTFDVPKDYQNLYGGKTYTYTMTLDALKDQIHLNDFDMLSNINGPMLTQYETDVTVNNFEFEDDNPSVTIDLSKYNMDIVKFNNNYYIPLYLANLILTGSDINVYEMNNDLYVFDTFTDMSTLTDKFNYTTSQNFNSLKTATQNYLALYFDYFYGLKKYKNVHSYKDVLADYNFSQARNVDDFNNRLEDFIFDLNDLHTSLISPGYMDQTFRPSQNTSDKATNYISAYYNNSCGVNQYEIKYFTYKDTILIKINQFTLNTRDLLKPIMEKAKNYDNVAIDLGCNPGGYVVGVMELLSYLTDQDIPLTTVNQLTGEKTTQYFTTSNTEKLDANFFIYTSAATYSAANLFTSYVKDYHLGLIAGSKAGGGAASITYTVLPDGAIIVNSSDDVFTNKDNTVIEDGIPVDINYTDTFGLNSSTIYDLFSSNSSIDVNKNMNTNSIDYNVSINPYYDASDISYKISVYNTNTNQKIKEQDFTTNQFTYTVDNNSQYQVKITVYYKYKDVLLHEVIYQDSIN